jgi:hypothetical protein
MTPPIFFFIPNSAEWSKLPTEIQQYWAWMRAQRHLAWWRQFNWTLQTYLRLNAQGFSCGLARDMPADGIVVAHRDFLPNNLRPSRRQLLVCLLADRNRAGSKGPHPYSQIHVVQNPTTTCSRTSRPNRERSTCRSGRNRGCCPVTRTAAIGSRSRRSSDTSTIWRRSCGIHCGRRSFAIWA